MFLIAVFFSRLLKIHWVWKESNHGFCVSVNLISLVVCSVHTSDASREAARTSIFSPLLAYDKYMLGGFPAPRTVTRTKQVQIMDEWMNGRTVGRTVGRTEPTVWSCTAINTWTTARSIVPNVEDTEGEVSVTLVKCSLSRGSFTRVELDFQTNVGITFLYFTWPYFEFRFLLVFNLFFFFNYAWTQRLKKRWNSSGTWLVSSVVFYF